MIKIGVIGLGAMGNFHAQALRELYSDSLEIGLFDPNSDTYETLELERFKCYESPLKLIEEVDAVIIASPDSSHFELVSHCINKLTPVLCEKPLASRLDEVSTLIELERKSGRTLISVGFMRRFDDYLRQGEDYIKGLSEQSLQSAYFKHRNVKSQAKSVEEVLIGSAIHEFDQLFWMMGKNPTEITTHYGGNNSNGEIGPLFIHLLLSSGTRLVVEVSVNAEYGYVCEVELITTKGTFETKNHPSDGGHSYLRSDETPGKEKHMSFIDRFHKAYRSELLEFVKQVGTPSPTRLANAQDAYNAQYLAELAISSFRERRTLNWKDL